jgi:hypothetical protein
MEDRVFALLEARGCTVVRQTTRAPFDLLVNGHRVDVKCGHTSIYGNDGRGHTYIGWTFRLAKVPPTCDFYLVLCLAADDSTERLYAIPSSAATVTMLTITPHGKYEKYRDALDLLRA